MSNHAIKSAGDPICFGLPIGLASANTNEEIPFFRLLLVFYSTRNRLLFLYLHYFDYWCELLFQCLDVWIGVAFICMLNYRFETPMCVGMHTHRLGGLVGAVHGASGDQERRTRSCLGDQRPSSTLTLVCEPTKTMRETTRRRTSTNDQVCDLTTTSMTRTRSGTSRPHIPTGQLHH